MFPVDVFRLTVEKLVHILQPLEVRFHLTGGVTSAAYGEPRMTQDIDIVVENAGLSSQLDAFLDALRRSDFLFDEQSIRQAVQSKGMFQLFDGIEALKLDLYPRELVAGELSRSRIVEIFSGVHLPIVSRVDAALSKLIWASKGSHKSRRDFRRMLQFASSAEQAEIKEVATQMNLEEVLREVIAEPDELS